MSDERIDLSKSNPKNVAELIEALKECPQDMWVGVGSVVGHGDEMTVTVQPAIGFARMTDQAKPDYPGMFALYCYDGEVQS